MKSLSTLAAAAALFLGLSVPAAADEWATLGAVGPWSLTANAQTCKADVLYKNGTSLSFYLGSDGVATMGIIQPNWRIPEGEYEVTLQVDRAPLDALAVTA